MKRTRNSCNRGAEAQLSNTEGYRGSGEEGSGLVSGWVTGSLTRLRYLHEQLKFDIFKNFVGVGSHKVGDEADMERLGYESDGSVQGEIPKESIQIKRHNTEECQTCMRCIERRHSCSLRYKKSGN